MTTNGSGCSLTLLQISHM